METKHWDVIIEQHDHTKPLVLSTEDNHPIAVNSFPIITRAWYDLIGWGPIQHIDSWVTEVSRNSNTLIKTDIEILHDRADLTGNNRDKTFNTRKYFQEVYDSPELQAERTRDTAIVKLEVI